MEIFQYGQTEIEYLKKKDKKLAEAIPNLFAALVNSIIGQQISMKAVNTILARMQDRFCEITPQTIASKTAEEVQQCGITMKKAMYIKNIAEAVLSGEFNIAELSQLPDDEVCKRLSALNGIGVWTAQMLMTFCLQRPNIVSWDDLAIRRGMMMLYHHRKLDKAKFERYKRRYSPYGTVAAFYLWETSVGQ